MGELRSVGGFKQDVFRRHTQIFCHELRDHRVMTLSLARRACANRDFARGFHPNSRALIGAHTGVFDTGRDTDTQIPAFFACSFLAFLETVVVGKVQSLLEQRFIITAVVNAFGTATQQRTCLIGHLIGAHIVPATHFGRVNTELSGDQLDHPFDRINATRTPRATYR